MSKLSLSATRREVVTGALSAALATASASAAYAETLNGKVIERGTGFGLEGVLVSDGRAIVATDSNGRWELPRRDNADVFVIKPTGWTTPMRECGLPEFCLTTDNANQSDINEFVLTQVVEPRRFDVALLADTQPQTMLELSYFRDTILPAVIGVGARLAINHGDVVFDNHLLHERYLSLVGSSGLVWHHCPGNHDMDYDQPPQKSFHTWRNSFGPCSYAFQYGGTTFILLNNVEPVQDQASGTCGSQYRGCVGNDQLCFVEALNKYIPKNELVVVSMNIPLVGWENPNDPASVTADRRDLMRLLSGRPNTLSLAGHTHTTEHHYLGIADGFSGPGEHHHHVLTAACGSWWSGPFDANNVPQALSRDGTPKGFHILSVDGSRFVTRFVAVDHTGNQNMRITLCGADHGGEAVVDGSVARSGTLSLGEAANTQIIVNVFDGGPRTTVTVRLSGKGSAHEAVLEKVSHVDPAVVAIYNRHRSELKSWVEPASCSHLWRGQLPKIEIPGSYVLQVQCRNENDLVHTGHLVLDVPT